MAILFNLILASESVRILGFEVPRWVLAVAVVAAFVLVTYLAYRHDNS